MIDLLKVCTRKVISSSDVIALYGREVFNLVANISRKMKQYCPFKSHGDQSLIVKFDLTVGLVNEFSDKYT